MSIADNIKRLRERFDLTQEELGEIAGVSGGAVSTWERGTADPRIGAVQKIADYLRISKSEIVDDMPATFDRCENAASEDDSASLSAAEAELVDYYRELNPDGQEKLLDYAEDLTEMPKYKKGHQHGAVEKEA